MKTEGSEEYHWGRLVDIKLSDYRKLVVDAKDPRTRRKLYESLEDCVERAEAIANNRGETPKGITKRPYSLVDYMDGLEPELSKRIEAILENPDKTKVKKILGERDNGVMARQFGMLYNTYVQVKNNLLRGKSRPTANYAKIVRYMLKHGYSR